jgi:hypothetical protein
MTNRREFIASSLLVSGASLLPPISAQAAGSELLAHDVDCFVYDLRFAEARALAEQASQRGIAPAPTTGDLMTLWYDYLDLRWKRAPMTLAGLTTHKGLFVLETLAADHGMHVVWRADLTQAEAAPHAGISDTALVAWRIAPRS